jgi:hypothetical protein
MIKLGTLRSLDARTAWVHEAHDFTPWLAQHLDLLGQALGLDLELEATEVSVGEFTVDIVARDASSGRELIVENQLESTDHSHLGQLLTYASGRKPAYVVWVAPRFRDDHRQALDWLNASTIEGIDFFGVELELLQIDDSPLAAHFKLVAQPNEWAKATRSTSATSSERGARYQAFFEQVLADFKAARPGLTSAARVGPQNWTSFTAGRPGFIFSWAIAGNRLRVEVYIDTGDAASTKALFDGLVLQREMIETGLGGPVSWERLDHRRASRIATYRDLPAGVDFDEAPEGRGWMVETMVRWNDILRPILATVEPVSIAAQPNGPPSPSV